MSNTTITNIPNVTTGILHPKLNNRFRVLFDTSNENDTEKLLALTNQVLQVYPFDVPIANKFGIVETNTLVIILEDDVTNKVSTGLQLIRQYDTIDIHLELLDGNNVVLEKYIFSKCQIGGILVHGFDYAGSTSSTNRRSISVENKSPDFNKLVNLLSDEAQALYHILRGLHISIDNYNGLATVQKQLTVSYTEFEHIIL